MRPTANNLASEIGRRPLAAMSAAAGVACAAALLLTSPGLPITWDEGNAIGRAEGIERWVGRWFRDASPAPLSKQAIAEDWQYTTQVEGHPAFYGIVMATGHAIPVAWMGPLDRWRLGPMLLFSLSAGAMFYRMGREYSIAAAVAAVVATLLLPRLFAHVHFASFDGTLTACWILAWATFAPACRNWWAIPVWAFALGMTLAAKSPGWIAPVPFLLWAILYRDRRAARTLLLGLPLALGVFYLLNPPLWHDPIDGLATCVRLNLDRSQFNISTQFFGRMYNLDYPLPWYNTLAWVGITVPTGTLALLIAGTAVVCKGWRRQPAGMLLLANAVVLLVVRAMPMAPPHDGVRLFLPSFAFLAALAGIGAAGLGALGRDSQRLPKRWLAPAAVVLLYLGSATSLAWYSPQWLSYYNLLIGGLPGATALGMEPTYYWDGLDRPVLEWLDEHTEPGEKVAFSATSSENLRRMRQWGTLRVEHRRDAPGRIKWYVLQHRPSGCWPADQWLIDRRETDQGRPAFTKTIRSGGVGPWRLGQVPLIDIYPYDRFRQAYFETTPRR